MSTLEPSRTVVVASKSARYAACVALSGALFAANLGCSSDSTDTAGSTTNGGGGAGAQAAGGSSSSGGGSGGAGGGEAGSGGSLPAAPNLLLIIADDFGLDKATLDPNNPCYDIGDAAEDPPMPNLSELCQTGVRFDNAYAMPTCSPTRATMLTGQWPFRHGVGSALGGGNQLSLSATTLPALIATSASNYASANIGKWHVSQQPDDPGTLGWGHYAGSFTGGLPNYSAWDRTVNGVTASSTGYATSVAVDDALDWIHGVSPSQPWLLWLAFNAPHSPFHKPPVELHDYDNLPETLMGDRRPYYAAMAQAMDTELGRLFNDLKVRGQWDNTIVVFVGDNGTPSQVASAPIDNQHAKGTLTQGGIAVPMLVAGPGVQGGRALPQLVSVVDVFATLLEAAQVDPAMAAPNITFDSVSLWPVLSGQNDEQLHPFVIAEQFGNMAMEANRGKVIRNEQYKLICFQDGRSELYDLVLDPWEAVDLIDNGTAPPAVVQTLSSDLETLVGADVCP